MKKEYKKKEYIKGVAGVVVAKDGSLRVKMEPDAVSGETGRSFDVPANKVFSPNPVVSGQWWVVLSGKGDALYSFSPPVKGQYYLRFKSIPGKADAPPRPWLDRGGPVNWVNPDTNKEQTWYNEPALKWTVVVEITRGKFAGSTARAELFYPFVVDPTTGFTKLFGPKGQVDKTETFLALAGVDLAEYEIPYNDETVLPEIGQLLAEAAPEHEFLGEVSRGKAFKFVALPDGADETPAKKPARKSAAKKTTKKK